MLTKSVPVSTLPDYSKSAAYNLSRHKAGRIYPLSFCGYLPDEIKACEPGSIEEATAIAKWQGDTASMMNPPIRADGALGPRTAHRMHCIAIMSKTLDPDDNRYTGYVTEHFKITDFACHDGTKVPEEYLINTFERARNLEVCRAEAFENNPIQIVSGYRTFRYNMNCGGAHDSKHLTATASDIAVWLKGKYLKEHYLDQYAWEEKIVGLMDEAHIPMGGVQAYAKGFCHTDDRGGNSPSHWDT